MDEVCRKRFFFLKSTLKEKSAEGVTLSGVPWDTKPCTDKPLESVVYDRRRCRGAGKSSPPVLISQAKGQGRCSNGNMHAGSVFVFRAGFYIVSSCPGVRKFLRVGVNANA